MDLQAAFDLVTERLARIDFSALWPGFRPLKFALYDGERCFFDGAFVPKTAEFMANTSIEYRGEQIAVWQLEGEPDPDRLAASLAHEMFHAFQTISGESRWADERSALLSYRYTPENLSLKLREAELMRRALEQSSRAAYEKLLALRRRRAMDFPAEYDYEARIEQIEGTANLVELEALGQLDPSKGRAGWEKLLERMEDPANYTPVRAVSYDLGAAFLACIRRFGAYDVHPFTDTPFALGVLAGVEPAAGDFPPDPGMGEQVRAYREETERIVRAALEKGEVALEGPLPLASLNVFDARWNGKYAVSTHFIAWWEAGEMRSLEGDFVAELDRDCTLRRVYRL